jgi:microtubule-associated protein, RP/EB family
MHRVKFETQQEFEYVANFKVLQKCFADHAVDKVVPVDRLVKCRMQDNLEFLQWVKKYWDTYYQGASSYDPVSRRNSKKPTGSTSTVTKPAARTAPVQTRPVAKPTVVAAPRAQPTPKKQPAKAVVPPQKTADDSMLQKQVTQLQLTVDALEKERDFYFSKLRDVEILVQNQVDEGGENTEMVGLCQQVLDILYKTEDGFEMPQDDQQQEQFDSNAQPLVDETF